jgi:hypothetical protein
MYFEEEWPEEIVICFQSLRNKDVWIKIVKNVTQHTKNSEIFINGSHYAYSMKIYMRMKKVAF